MEAWQKTRDRYEAEGFGLPADHPLCVEASRLAAEERDIKKQLRAILGHGLRSEAHLEQEAMRSRRVPRPLKDKLRAVQHAIRNNEMLAMIETSHEHLVRKAVAAGLPVPPAVLAEYPGHERWSRSR